MKSLVCTRPRNFEYQAVDEPKLSAGNSIIKIKRVGVCGTDLHAFDGTQPFLNYPRILGHELAGELVACNDAHGFGIGELVTIIPYYSCGVCIACRLEKSNCCEKIQVCGVHIDGGMTEYLSVPSNALLHGNGLTVDELAMVEPFAIGAHGVRRAAIQSGEFVLVVGAGPIGLATMEFARLAGGQVIALDVNNKRLQFCKEKLNVEHTVNPTDTSVFETLRKITDGDMPTVVIDATGSQTAINAGFQYMAHGARYILIGLQRGEIGVSHPEFHKREGTLMSSRNATREDFDNVIAVLKRKEINPSTYITHRAKFDDVKDEFPTWLDPSMGVIKAMIEF